MTRLGLWNLGLAIAVLGHCPVQAQSSVAEDKSSMASTQMLLTQHCQKCHSGTHPNGEFNIENLTPDFVDRKNREKWLALLEQLNSGNMPPMEEPRPPGPAVNEAVE